MAPSPYRSPMKRSDPAREIAALSAWLQTFPSFDIALVVEGETNVADRLFQVLDDLDTARAVWRVAQLVCGDDSASQDDSTMDEPDQIWTSIMILASKRARPAVVNEKLSPERMKCHVLSSLLDSAVSFPEITQRRELIQRIMTLPKETQKTLMALIEQRSKAAARNSSAKRKTPKIPSSIRRSSYSASSPAAATPTSPRARRSGIPTYSGDNPSTPVRSNTRSSADSRKHDSAFGRSPPSTGYTPPPKQRLLSSMEAMSSTPGFLSPGTLESPGKLQNIVVSLKQRNNELQSKVEAATTAEEGLRQELEAKDQKHRQRAIKLESTHLHREQELRERIELQEEKYENELEMWREKAARGQEAEAQLRRALDDLELMQYDKQALSETTEKMNKFREKVGELADVKDALAREQSQHAQAIDELVQLEAQVETLETTKRQLDDYKIRAIEAEVKLVECQDYLRRLEQENSQHSAVQASMYQGTVMQKEQMEEMIARIQQETQAGAERGVVGIGEGVNEMNMEIKQELAKLRNENLSLRAFAAKRQNDEVDKLESALEEARMFVEKYKKEYLSAKEGLAETQARLRESEGQEAKLEREVDEWKRKYQDSDAKIRVLTETLEVAQSTAEELQQDLTESMARNEQLGSDLHTWTSRARESQKLAAERQEQVQGLTSDLEGCQNVLEQAEQSMVELEQNVNQYKAQTAKYQDELETLDEELTKSELLVKTTQTKLQEANEREADLNDRLELVSEEKAELETTLEKEKISKESIMKEADMALLDTKEALKSRSTEMENLQANMNKLLEDERSATSRKMEEAKEMIQSVDGEWKAKYTELENRTSQTLEATQEDSRISLERLKEKHASELEAAQTEAREAKESCDNIVRKGRAMLEEAKAKAMVEFQELKDEMDSLRAGLDTETRAKEELEISTRRKVAALKQKLTVSTNQVAEYSKEVDELHEQIKLLEREKYKLSEDNDRYRRQLGGRYGADGKVQSQLEKLQNEYSAILLENRNLKKQSRSVGRDGLGSISESTDDDSGRSYRSTRNRSTLSQLRQEYEETIEGLKDEKRELVMRNSAAITDVQKAEQRVWEQEQEVTRLKAELTSCHLHIQRLELAKEGDNENAADPTPREKELSFFSAHDRSPPLHGQSPALNRSNLSASSLSPSIERAMKQKAASEEALRDRFTSLTGSPSRIPRRDSHSGQPVLSPTKRHEQASNMSMESSRGASPALSSRRSPAAFEKQNSMVDLMKEERASVDMDGQPECKQS